MATIALFIALGGTGYAALQLPPASVGAKHLKKNSVTAKKIKKGAVTGRSVKDGSLGRRDFATNDPEGNASALPMKVLDGCSSNEIEVRTERLNVSGGTDSVVSNSVSFFVAVL